MAEFQNWNIGREFQAGLERGQQTRRQDQFRALAGQAINAPAAERDALIQQAVANDPETGFALQKQLEADTDRRQTALFNMARGFKQIHSKNPAQAMAYFQRQIAPGLVKIGFDVDPNTPETEVVNVVDQVLATYGGDDSAEPAGFRQIDLAARAAGFEPGTPEYQNYFQVHGGIKGRAPTGGFNFELVPGVGYVRENPRSGTLELYDQTTRSIVPVVGGADINAGGADHPQAAPPAQGGVVVTNEQGERGRYSIGRDGRPVFIAESVPANVAQGITADPAAFQGQDVTLPPQAQAPSPAVQRFGDITTRTPEQQAYLTEQEKERARLDAYTRATELEADRESAKTTARETAEARAQKAQALPQTIATADETIGLLDRALSHPGRTAATGASSALDPRNRIPGTDAYDFNVLLDQIKGQAFLQAFQSLRGGGAITEREGTAATNAIARLNAAQSEEEFAKSLGDLKRIVQDARGRAIRSVSGEPDGQPQPKGIPRPKTQAEYDALPSGAVFINRDGKTYRK